MDRASRADATTKSLLSLLSGDETAFERIFGRKPTDDAAREGGPEPIATAQDYAELFGTTMGYRVLCDMTERFFCRTYYTPGGGSTPQDAVFGEGVRMALIDILTLVERGKHHD